MSEVDKKVEVARIVHKHFDQTELKKAIADYSDHIGPHPLANMNKKGDVDHAKLLKLLPNATNSLSNTGSAQKALPSRSVVSGATSQVISGQGNYFREGNKVSSKTLPKGAIYAKMKLRGQIFYAMNPMLLHALAKRKFDVGGPHIEFYYGTWGDSPVVRTAMLDYKDSSFGSNIESRS